MLPFLLSLQVEERHSRSLSNSLRGERQLVSEFESESHFALHKVPKFGL